MASFIGSDQELLCPICACCYNTPRKLPGCIHSFCERCILTSVQNLRKDEKLGDTFECPVCRLPSASPEEDNITSEWVQTLDIDKELDMKVEKQNEYNSKWCSQCRYVDKFIKSKVYCSSCKDSFCEKCSETLHYFKMNREHAIVDIKGDGENENIHDQAVQLLQKFLSCSYHPEKRMDFFCQDDEKFCCTTCVTSEHQQCVNNKLLQDLLENDYDRKPGENSSVQLLDSLSKLNDHIQSIVNLIKDKDAETKKAPEKRAVEFQSIKEKVIRLLDTVEESISQDSKAFSKATSMKSLDEIEVLNVITSEINVATYLLNNLVGKLPRDSAMVCYRKAKLMLQSLERKVIERGSFFETEELLLKIEEEFHKIINLGPNETEHIISVKTNGKSYPLPRLSEKFLMREGKIELVDEKNNCISEISPGDNPRYNCITFLPNNNLILTDSYYGICLLVDANLQPTDSINFKVNQITEKSTIDSNLIYSSCLANGLIAISVCYEKKICFLSAAGNELEKKGEVVCKYLPTAIHGLRNSDLSVLWKDPSAVGVITFYGGLYRERVYFKSDTEGRSIKHRNRLAVDEDRHHVVLSWKGIKTAEISCYDFDGNKIFEYNHSEIKDPRGMGLDADGNIYVCDIVLGRICVLSPEGLLVRMLQEGCPAYPLGIGFSKNDNIFAVTQRNPDYKKVLFFSIRPIWLGICSPGWSSCPMVFLCLQ